MKQALHTMTHYYDPGAPYFYLCVQNKCYLFTSCEQGCLLLHPKKIQVFCVGVDDLYNNKWKSKQTTCMQKYIGLNTNNLHNNNIKMVKINEILSEECVFSVC